MKIAFFYHSLLSDWNHGNAHFLRGIATELLARGHEVKIYEPRDGWSLNCLLQEHGDKPLRKFRQAYPDLTSQFYDANDLDLHEALGPMDMVMVHEWNEPSLVKAIGEYRREHPHFRLYFHDTHHRMVTEPDQFERFDLREYDGVLAYGEVLRQLYLRRKKHSRVWTWHEAADVRVFRPMEPCPPEGDFVWIGNWGDGERTAELHEFLIQPSKSLKLKTRVYGVRYPQEALSALADAQIEFAGWAPNFEVPKIFGQYSFTVHVPRRPYVQALPGIPTIRVFEALACGIPLICSPWVDTENLFRPGQDYLVAKDGREMEALMKQVVSDESLRAGLRRNGLETIRARHTCWHRVNELLSIDNAIQQNGSAVI